MCRDSREEPSTLSVFATRYSSIWYRATESRMLPRTVVLCLPESGFSSASSAGTCLLVINAPCLVLRPSSLSHKILKSLRQKLCPVQLVVPVEASTEPQQATGTQEMLDTLTKCVVPKEQDLGSTISLAIDSFPQWNCPSKLPPFG